MNEHDLAVFPDPNRPELLIEGHRAVFAAWPPAATCERCGVEEVAGYVFPVPDGVPPNPIPYPSNVELLFRCSNCALPSHALTYRGNPSLVSLLAQMLRERGVRVEYEPPQERRDLATAVQSYVVAMAAWGSVQIIEATIAKFRERHGNQADAEVDSDGADNP